MIKQKKKFVNVTPLTHKSRIRFINMMDSFHACEVECEDDKMFYLLSLNKMYRFCCLKTDDDHWKIEK